ncbi:MAG TPA: DUF4188 domain-containing protein [Kineosporiaceae bacterium]|nr:DUF4188 domain-containing protein [Kineosporiaceae bacterium]
MRELLQGRWTHERASEGVVVFLIGARVNRLRSVRAWLPVISAMPRMLAELQREPDLGLLGVTSCVHGKGALAVQYWRDLDSLLAYAHATDHAHRPAWREFNQRVRAARGAVGIWHETFVVPPGAHESMYVDMPAQGLPLALGPRDPRTTGTRERLQVPR